MRLSKRTRQVLELLGSQYREYSEEEKLQVKELLEKYNFAIAGIQARLGKAVDSKKLEVTDEDLQYELQLRKAIPLKRIITVCEGLDEVYKQFFEELGRVKHEKELYADPHYNPSYLHWYGIRHHVSLTEVIASKLFPKGRSWRRQVYSKHFDGYEEAFKKAKSLQVSYSRVLNNLLDQGLVDKFHSKYNQKQFWFHLTEKGNQLLTTLNTDRVVNN